MGSQLRSDLLLLWRTSYSSLFPSTTNWLKWNQTYRKDMWQLKLLVGSIFRCPRAIFTSWRSQVTLVWALDTAHQGMIIHAGYIYLITQYGNALFLATVVVYSLSVRRHLCFISTMLTENARSLWYCSAWVRTSILSTRKPTYSTWRLQAFVIILVQLFLIYRVWICTSTKLSPTVSSLISSQ